MKMNLKVRAKNPYFWVGIIGVILTAMGVSAETFTTWQVVVDQLKALISNPFMLGSVILAVFGAVYDPTTSGVGDSGLVMSRQKPGKQYISAEELETELAAEQDIE